MSGLMTYIHCEMITTISLVNIHHLVKIKKVFFPCDENSLDLLSYELYFFSSFFSYEL